MGKLLAVIRREYIERVRNRWFIVVTVFGPVFFGAVMILPAFLSIRGMRNAAVPDIRILDATGTALGDRLAARVAEKPRNAPDTWRAPNVRVDVVAPADLPRQDSLMVGEVMAKRLTGFVTLDTATVATGRAAYAGRNASSVGENERLESALRGALLALRLERAGVTGAAADSVARLRVNLDAVRVGDRGRAGSGIAGMIFGFIIAFMLYISIILYGQTVLRGVLEEKTTRVAEVIVASVKPDILLAGKVIGVGAVGLTQFAIWIASGVFFWGERARLMGGVASPSTPEAAEAMQQASQAFTLPTIEVWQVFALLLFFLLGYVLYASLFAAVGSMVSSQEEANQAVQPVMMLLVFSIIFVQPVATNPTGTLAVVMSRIPFSAPIIMPLRMTASPVSPLEVAAVLAGLALACFGAIWLSARIYRVGLLMYGKRPSLRELGRWIRQS